MISHWRKLYKKSKHKRSWEYLGCQHPTLKRSLSVLSTQTIALTLTGSIPCEQCGLWVMPDDKINFRHYLLYQRGS